MNHKFSKDKTLLGKKQGEIWQYKDHFRFGEDSVLLAHFAYEIVKKRGPYSKIVFDVCAGSGVVGILFRRLLNQKVRAYGLEYMPVMFDLLKENYRVNHLEEEFWAIQGDLSQNFNTWGPLPEEWIIQKEMADVILMNPPYARMNQKVMVEHLSEESKIARFEIQGDLSAYLKQIALLLKPEALLILCLPLSRMNELCFYAMKEGLFLETLRLVHTYAHKESKLGLFAFKKSKKETQVKVLAPLILRKEDGTYTEELENWYREEEFS